MLSHPKQFSFQPIQNTLPNIMHHGTNWCNVALPQTAVCVKGSSTPSMNLQFPTPVHRTGSVHTICSLPLSQEAVILCGGGSYPPPLQTLVLPLQALFLRGVPSQAPSNNSNAHSYAVLQHILPLHPLHYYSAIAPRTDFNFKIQLLYTQHTQEHNLGWRLPGVCRRLHQLEVLPSFSSGMEACMYCMCAQGRGSYLSLVRQYFLYQQN